MARGARLFLTIVIPLLGCLSPLRADTILLADSSLSSEEESDASKEVKSKTESAVGMLHARRRAPALRRRQNDDARGQRTTSLRPPVLPRDAARFFSSVIPPLRC